jgi:hypothetical protein
LKRMDSRCKILRLIQNHMLIFDSPMRILVWSDKAIYDQYMLQLSQEQQDQNEGG